MSGASQVFSVVHNMVYVCEREKRKKGKKKKRKKEKKKRKIIGQTQ